MGLRLSWVDRNIGADNETSLRIYRSTSSFTSSNLPPVLATVAADVETYLDETVAANETYYYMVEAVGPNGSRFTDTVSASTTVGGGGSGLVIISQYDVTITQRAETLVDYAFPIDLSLLPAQFWADVAVGGTNIRAFTQAGVQLPLFVSDINKTDNSGVVWVKETLSGTAATTIRLAITDATERDLKIIIEPHSSYHVFSGYEAFFIGGVDQRDLVSETKFLTGSAYFNSTEVTASSVDTNIHEGFAYDESGDRWFAFHTNAIYFTTSPFGTYTVQEQNLNPAGDVTTYLNNGNTYTDMNGGTYDPATGYVLADVYGAGGTIHAIARFNPNLPGFPLVDAHEIYPAQNWNASDLGMKDGNLCGIAWDPAGVSTITIAQSIPPYAVIETITLAEPVFFAQGIDWYPRGQCFVISAATAALYTVDTEGRVNLVTYEPGLITTQEGIVTTEEGPWYWLNVEDKVHRVELRHIPGCISGGANRISSAPFYRNDLTVGDQFTFGVSTYHETTANKYLASVFDVSGGSVSRVSIYEVANNPRFESGFGSGVINSTGGVAANTHNRFDVRRDANNYELFKNGVSQGTSIRDVPTGLDAIAFGSATESAAPFNGMFSVGYLRNEALSDTWIETMWQLLSNPAGHISATVTP